MGAKQSTHGTSSVDFLITGMDIPTLKPLDVACIATIACLCLCSFEIIQGRGESSWSSKIVHSNARKDYKRRLLLLVKFVPGAKLAKGGTNR
jgi:hypothetical protein